MRNYLVVWSSRLTVAVAVVGGSASLVSANEYHECIFRNAVKAETETAAKAIIRSCEIYKSSKSEEVKRLPDSTLDMVSGVGDVTGEFFEGTIHNNTSNSTITQLLLLIRDKRWTKRQEHEASGRIYQTNVHIEPHSASDVRVKVINPGEHYDGWAIVALKGYIH